MIPETLDNALGFNLYRVNLLMRRELMQALSDYEITPEQWQIMSILRESKAPLNQREIVQDTLKDKYTVSRIINRLERDGWVTKKVSPNDKRSTLIGLTEKSNTLQKNIQKLLSDHFNKIFKAFGKDDHDHLLELLKKLRKILKD
ncbi:MAG: MarR family transcriptional regulator [Desulfobacterales bacterium]|nr:MarR family transcriptional regulator [Desulfobacterales bacterium]MCP4163263.1 MarR family transcriptional regulator [Deltaproteobacteria bacterium]